eukprot:2701570-Rhodomonas_salina.3
MDGSIPSTNSRAVHVRRLTTGVRLQEVEGAEDCGSAKRRAGQAAKVQLELVVAQERNPSIDWQVALSVLRCAIAMECPKQCGN